jgi:hypothetical protein
MKTAPALIKPGTIVCYSRTGRYSFNDNNTYWVISNEEATRIMGPEAVNAGWTLIRSRRTDATYWVKDAGFAPRTISQVPISLLDVRMVTTEVRDGVIVGGVGSTVPGCWFTRTENKIVPTVAGYVG